MAELIRLDTLSENVTVTVGGTTSAAFATRGRARLGLVIPSTFDGTAITFTVSADGVTYQGLYTTANVAVGLGVVAASRSYDLPPELYPWPYIKIVCGSTQTTTDTVFTIVAKS